MANLNNIGEIRGEVLVRAQQNTTTATNALYTDTILNDWLDPAHKWAAAYKPWPFAEGRVSTTYVTSSTDDLGSVRMNYPEGWKTDSIRILFLGGKRLQKLNYEDFLIFREERSAANDRVYSDFGRVLYVNPNIDVSGTLTAWGQYTPKAFDLSLPEETTVFSDNEDEGNEAIVEEILSYAKTREQKLQEAQIHHQKAIEILERIWKRVEGEQFAYHTKNRGMFQRFDVTRGSLTDDLFKRDQFF